LQKSKPAGLRSNILVTPDQHKKRRVIRLVAVVGVVLLCIWYFATNTNRQRFDPEKHGHFSKVETRIYYANNRTKIAKTITVDPRGDTEAMKGVLGIQPDNTLAMNPDARVTSMEGGVISISSSGVIETPAVTKDGVTSFEVQINRATIFPILKQEVLILIVTDRGLSIRPTISAVVRPSFDAQPQDFIPITAQDAQMIFVPDKLAQSYKLVINRAVFPGEQLIITASWPSKPSSEN
jgi:hypothetical protein